MAQKSIKAFHLALHLQVEKSDLITAARALGFDLKNGLSSVTPEQQAALEERFRKAPPQATAPAPVSAYSSPDSGMEDVTEKDIEDLDDETDEDELVDELDEDIIEDDLDEDDLEGDDDEADGGHRIDHTEEKELQEDYEPEEDDKDPGDYEAEGPEEYGCDPDYY